MRGSAWTLPTLAIVCWIAAIVWPILASIETIFTREPSGIEIRRTWQLLIDSSAWGLAVAIGAMILGWPAGRLLGAAISRKGFLPLAVFILVPICLPAYVVFFAWWQAWPADTFIYRWAVEHQQVQTVRHATLLIGFLCWSWPIVAWCVAGSVASTPAQREELLRLDGAGTLRRLADRLRCDGRAMLIGGLIVFLATFNNTVCFDLAEIFTFGNELRAIEALGATPRDVLGAAMPATLLTMLGAAAIWFLLSMRASDTLMRTSPARWPSVAWTITLWVISVGFPLGLLSRNLAIGAGGRELRAQINEFQLFYGTGMINTILIALACALLGLIIAIGLSWMWQDHRRWVRMIAHVQAVGWIIGAAVPGTMVGVAMRVSYNRGVFADLIYTQPAILIIGHLARFAFIAALLGRWMAKREAPALRDLRRLDGADRFLGLLRATWPRVMAAGVASFAVILVLSLSEIPVTAAVRPPGFDVIAPSILNDMHFQRPQTVMIATAVFLVLAIIAAIVTVMLWWIAQRFAVRSAAWTLMLCALLLLPGCGSGEEGTPLRTEITFGSAGRALGQFYYPRAIAIDHEREYLFIVDRTARIQRYDFDGRPQHAWRMPEHEMGQPVGVTVSPDGRVCVADTHYYRVICYDKDGNELLRFGSFGEGPGQFIYTTGIAVGPEGRFYVAETGGNDRVQVFDADGNYLFEFGSFGSGEGQFIRPQGITFNHDMSELYIADACNHRIAVYDPEGNLLRYIGEPGRALGQLAYPYGVMTLSDGSVLVVEFHNNRLQKFARDGTPRGIYGRLGFREGELQYPWAVVGDDRTAYVVDSGNNRVQRIRTP